MYTDIGNVVSKIKLSVTDDPKTNSVEELVEVRDSGCYSDIALYVYCWINFVLTVYIIRIYANVYVQTLIR